MDNKSLGSRIEFWIYLNKEDISAVFKYVVPFSLGVCMLMYSPNMIRKYTAAKLDAQTIGIIDTIEKREIVVYSDKDWAQIIKNYKIDYHYIVNEEKIEYSEIIDRSQTNEQQRAILNEIQKGDTVKVNYDSENIHLAKIDIKNEQ